VKWLMLLSASVLRGVSRLFNLPATFVALPAARLARRCELRAGSDEPF
jgi:ABC-type enterobactin transport system permease subunit